MRLETTILANMIQNEEYARKVIPFIDPSYFHDHVESTISKLIVEFFNKYNKLPNKEILGISLANSSQVSDTEYESAVEYIQKMDSDSPDTDWLLEHTEKFCQDRALHNAILTSIGIIEGKSKTLSKDAIPELMKDALAISFDSDLGHDYLEDASERWEYYHAPGGVRIPFRLDLFNKITKGGLKVKTLNAIIAGTGVGKTIFMCDYAAWALYTSHNVVYFTMEMDEVSISERIDANLMKITMDDVTSIDKEMYLNKINKIKEKTQGKLIVKEYPAGSVHAGHFRAFLTELKLKKNFTPDLIVVDYLGICASQRIKSSNGVNTNTYYKTVAEELRALAQEYEVPVLTGVQLNRSGQNNSDVDLTNTADSIGLPQTLDLLFAVMAPEEMVELGQLLVKQLKNRYRDMNYFRKFAVGLDKPKMTFYNVEQSAQEDISEAGYDKPVSTIGDNEVFNTFKFSD